MQYDKKVRDYTDQSYSVQQLLRQYYGIDVGVGSKFLCPFHQDNKDSAQLFADNRFFCHAERVQYSPFRMLLAMGAPYEEMAKLVPSDFVPADIQKKLFDVELYKQLVFMFSKVFQRDHNIASIMDNWISVMENEESELG